MNNIIGQNNQVFGNYYNRINNLILRTKQNVVKILILKWSNYTLKLVLL